MDLNQEVLVWKGTYDRLFILAGNYFIGVEQSIYWLAINMSNWLEFWNE